MKKLFWTFICFTLFLVSCTERQAKYRIGISQCSEDIWRDKQNYELRMGTYFHNNVELKFAAAHDNDERQVQQIDSLVNEGIDLLIVAPNQVQTISPAIDRTFDKGIPVIVSERKTNSRKYTAFIGADNYEMGRVMGEYIISCLHGRGTVLEIKGLEGSSPAIERHNGFIDALKNAPQIKLVASLQGDWTENTGYETTRQWLANHQDEHVDLVFGANDRTAMGARKALGNGVRYCGIDGLQGEGGGIQLVRDSLLEASYIYPTHGDQLIDLAVKILEGQPYEKETMMMSALVTRDNAKVLLMQNEELMRQTHRLDQIHQKADSYLRELNTQYVINWLAAGVIVLLLLVIVLTYLQHLRKLAIQRERVTNTIWNMEPISSVEEQQTHEDVAKEEETNASSVEGTFISHFREVVETRLGDSDLSVDDLASAMNLSRVQLYRKVKAMTGSSPVELLRTARLNRAYQILLTTDKSVSEVAYAVGFTAPSYFTKCFKEAYGMVPGDVRK